MIRQIAVIVLPALLFTGVTGCKHAERANTVASYLDGAERQSETEEQRREIERALADMLELDSAALRTRRYADAAMKENAWTVIEILHEYFLPMEPMVLDPEDFYRDVKDPSARATIQKQLQDVRHALAADREPSPN